MCKPKKNLDSCCNMSGILMSYLGNAYCLNGIF